MISSTLKIPILILGAWLADVAIKPPQPPAQTKKGDKLSSRKQFFEKYIGYWPHIVRYGNTAVFLLEAVILVLLHWGNAEVIPKTLCPKLPSKEELSMMPPLFILGMTFLFLGGLLRLWCYQVMGNLFTFEISIRPSHKLITHGPYAIVRHPSYLAIALLYNGLIMAEANPNGYLTSCGVFSTYGFSKWIFIGWIVLLEWIVYSLAVLRPPVEDKNMKAVFGKEWEEYYERVPFRLVPGVF